MKIGPETTVLNLLNDACDYWGISKGEHSLFRTEPLPRPLTSRWIEITDAFTDGSARGSQPTIGYGSPRGWKTSKTKNTPRGGGSPRGSLARSGTPRSLLGGSAGEQGSAATPSLSPMQYLLQEGMDCNTGIVMEDCHMGADTWVFKGMRLFGRRSPATGLHWLPGAEEFSFADLAEAQARTRSCVESCEVGDCLIFQGPETSLVWQVLAREETAHVFLLPAGGVGEWVKRGLDEVKRVKAEAGGRGCCGGGRELLVKAKVWRSQFVSLWCSFSIRIGSVCLRKNDSSPTIPEIFGRCRERVSCWMCGIAVASCSEAVSKQKYGSESEI